MASLKLASLRWALKHVIREGDTDVFPRPFEFEVIKKRSSKTLQTLASIQIESHNWEGPRRLMVPKADFAFRPVCQFDPLDAILYAALIKEIGAKIEKKRVPDTDDSVFSYRFSPMSNGQLYASMTGWERFWKTSKELCDQYSHILVTDISDFYNQIYHHTIENQLDECGVGKSHISAIKKLLANTTEGVSRGVPIGPHPSHLIAEMSLIPVDKYLQGLGVRFCRYVDDIHIFCHSRDKAHEILFDLVEYLDKTQKLQTNRQKTKIYNSEQFSKICADNVIDKPISALESKLLSAVKVYTRSPYERVTLKKVSAVDLATLSKDNIESVLRDYIEAKEVDYVRLRWFIRRLTQVGAPGGISFIVKNFEEFLPAIADVARYFEASAGNYDEEWRDVGEHLLKIYDLGIIQASEYLRIVILSLFSGIKGINHVDSLTAMYTNSSPMCQRKILLAAAEAKGGAWLSGKKSAYKNADAWTRRAAIYCMRALPRDERKFWAKNVKTRVTGIDKEIVDAIS